MFLVRNRDASSVLGFVLLAVVVIVGASCTSATPAGESTSASTIPSSAATDNARTVATSIASSTTSTVAPEIESTPSASGQPERTGTLVAHAITPTIVAYSRPFNDSRLSDPATYAQEPVELHRFNHPTDRGGPLVFQVVDSPSLVGSDWIEVLLPIRPNGTTGWIKSDSVDLTVNPYRIEIDVDDFTLRILRDGDVTLETPVAIGAGETPTPLGEFYLVELLRPSNQNGVYGPYAYGLSGYSDTLQSFNGGEGVIGIHGTNQPSAIGSQVSHGCIRVENSVIRDMATFLPLGTPVRIDYGEPKSALIGPQR